MKMRGKEKKYPSLGSVTSFPRTTLKENSSQISNKDLYLLDIIIIALQSAGTIIILISV